MATRLKDVAERAGVSVKTASNVVNNYPHIKPSTRQRVETAIRELRYRPNVSARQLKHGRAGFLALAIPQLDSPYFAELAAKIT
ncbi:MAG TPA: LacI family DNA-binding transcriptional regulator, partial [Propionibacteriaceae bacterium]